tara:strand:+ start:284 stop:769 length:486 start_codon:yes stop_codon:yes gene_type:complete
VENQQGFFSRKLRAGKKRSYFFDVRSTKQGDFFVTITESKKRYDRPGYDSHKIFLYKEDFKDFQDKLSETLDHIKTELNPTFDYENYNRQVYSEQVEKDKAENPEKYANQPAQEINIKTTRSELKSGDYLDQYDGKETSTETESPKIDNDTNDDSDDAMNW